ncbi:GNAT family N-acetyltransferase [Pseudonocardia nematodicida]|uniref:GNAT family N-acetyltransferase n=1 Tax=Pseudonocardia nematodicida TaxID=1206997 RepID=A0ABV1K7M9_9PSEU
MKELPVIRPYDPTDRDDVVALSLRAWAPVFDSIEAALHGSGVYELQFPDGWEPAQRAAVTGVCESGTARVWVVEPAGTVAGFVAVQQAAEEGCGEIVMLAVDPAAQRRGLGAALTRTALDWMRAQGMTVAMVETGGDPGHAPARAAYAAAGFHLLPVARYFRTL